jgi:hypothetical protein
MTAAGDSSGRGDSNSTLREGATATRHESAPTRAHDSSAGSVSAQLSFIRQQENEL